MKREPMLRRREECLDDVPFHFKEALCIHEAFRKMGYPSEEIFIGFAGSNSNKGILVQVILKSEGKQFACDVLVVKGVPTDKLVETWKRSAHLWNTSSDSQKMKLWNTSIVRKDSVGFVASLVLKGFAPKRKNLS